MNSDAVKAASAYALPVAVGMFSIGVSYGFMMVAEGFSFWYPFLMAGLIFAGTMEIITSGLLQGAVDPLNAFILAVLVNSRHLFYGISMLSKYANMGWKKPLLIFAMCDEAFAINSVVKIPYGVDKGAFMLAVTGIIYSFWVSGALVGGLVGAFIPVDSKGIEFGRTALFVIMFLDVWKNPKNRSAGIVGVVTSILSLLIVGPVYFLIPSMVLMVVWFLFVKRRKEGAV